MSTIQWQDSHSVNNPEIDKQHQEWIAIYDRMHSVLLSCTPEAGSKVLKEMMDYTYYHFHQEEDLMRSLGYPGIIQYCRLHKDFDNLVYQQYRAVNERRELVLNSDILGTVKEWLLDHILVEDMKYSDFSKDAE